MSQVLPFHFLLLRRIKGEHQAQDVTVTDFRSFLQPQWPTNQWYQCAQNCNTMYGIRETALSWIKSYLGDRAQFVQLASSRSYQRRISWGGPQDSILGPFRIITYLFVMSLAWLNLYWSLLFADETKFFVPEGYRPSYFYWTCRNSYLAKSSLNLTKTNSMIFHPRKMKINAGVPLGKILWSSKN